MKRIMLFLLTTILISCNDNEETIVDPIIGTWQVISSKVDGTEVHSTNDCNKDNSITYFYDGKIKDSYSYINLQNKCVYSEDITYWENLGNSRYKFYDLEYNIEVEIVFPDINTFIETVIIEISNKDVTFVTTRKRS